MLYVVEGPDGGQPGHPQVFKMLLFAFQDVLILGNGHTPTSQSTPSSFLVAACGSATWLLSKADSLTVESLLELLDEDNLRKNSALPSPEWSSDHIALLVEFNCRPRTTC
ncbi:Carbon catabolite repressor protein 4 like 2 [Apostasia shenzhenica]|uniref:Carbon catabolite repressor protein 4 like 2 n=1 Tax=Apostasia shenzhenica TaxID=1088818 RepID=A0A2H9ZQM4_9ASPA|nr:Carbon catabolite repressor protein 4 like 2 [Apostasia shenzhenica]